MNKVIEIINKSKTKNKQLLIYIHIPFCVSRCNYCCWSNGYDYEDTINNSLYIDKYIDSIILQIKELIPVYLKNEYTVSAIYWGGGTPSILSKAQIKKVLDQIHELTGNPEIVEHTFEANPNSLSKEKIDFLINECCVNRISLGIQSFINTELKNYNRIYTSEEAISTINDVKNSGIEKFNIDLLCSYPGQSWPEFKKTLDTAIDLKIPHVTVYPTKIYKGTKLYNAVNSNQMKKNRQEDDETCFRNTIAYMKEAGYTESLIAHFVQHKKHESYAELYVNGLYGNILGLGCGAYSISNNHYWGVYKKPLEQFLTYPLTLDFLIDFSKEPQYIVPFFHRALLTNYGINKTDFINIFGIDFAEYKKTDNFQTSIKKLTSRQVNINEDNERLYIDGDNRFLNYFL